MSIHKTNPIANPIATTEVDPTLAEGFEDRYQKLPEESKKALLADPNLRTFLKAAIDFVIKEPHTNEGVAHYLMGKVNYLPDLFPEIEENKKPSAETREILYDLLRTHRYGPFGRSEEPVKTIAKFEALLNHLENEDGQKVICDTSNKWINRLLKYLFCTEKLAETRVPDPLPA